MTKVYVFIVCFYAIAWSRERELCSPISVTFYSACYSQFTSANVENMIVSVLGLDSVYCNLGQFSSAWLCLQQDRFLVLRKDWAVHHGMGTYKTQDLIRKLLRAGETSTVHFTGALLKRSRDKDDKGGRSENAVDCVEIKPAFIIHSQTVSSWPTEVATTVLTFSKAALHSFNTVPFKGHLSWTQIRWNLEGCEWIMLGNLVIKSQKHY